MKPSEEVSKIKMDVPAPQSDAVKSTDESLATQSPDEELKAILSRLNACFKIEASWPQKSDLHRFRELIPILYKETGSERISAAYFWNMIKAVNKQWPALRLIESLERLVGRFVKVAPVAPGVHLLRLLEKEGKTIDPKDGHPLFQLLNQINVGRKSAKWSDLSKDLDKLISDDTQAALGGVATAPETLGWIKFLDVHRQTLIWRVFHQDHYNYFLRWVYDLRNDDLNNALKSMSWGTEPLPKTEEWKKAQKRTKARLRKRKGRANKKISPEKA